MRRRELPQAESEFRLLPGLRIHELHWRAVRSTHPIVLLHGLASNARIWELCAPRLAAAGFDTWAIDLRGHGLSGKPASGYNFPTVRRDLERWILAHRLRRPLLIGHSWGAYLAIDYARRNRAGAGSPRGLVLVDGALSQLADIPGASWSSVRRQLAPPRLTGITVDELRQRLTAPGRAWTPNARAQQIVLANFQIDRRGRIRPHLTRPRHLRLLRSIWDYRAYRAYPELACPVLLLPAAPRSPRTTSEELFLAEKRKGAAIALEQMPEARVHWMRDTVHDIPLQRPQALANQILCFAERLRTS